MAKTTVPLQQPEKSGVKVIWVVIATVVLLVFGLAVYQYSPKGRQGHQILADSNKQVQTAYSPRPTEAYGYATTYVRAELKCPSTARFSRYTDPMVKVRSSGNVFTVSGWVDAQNSFGASIRTTWTVTLESDGQGAWRPLNVSIGDP